MTKSLSGAEAPIPDSPPVWCAQHFFKAEHIFINKVDKIDVTNVCLNGLEGKIELVKQNR